jgi:23S rRNA G2445 N2-methylase RlmL
VTFARLLARTVRGLESVACTEINGLGWTENVRHREVVFCAPAVDPRVLQLRTVDDVAILAAETGAVSTLVSSMDVTEVLALRQRFSAPMSDVDVSASVLGPLKRFDVEDEVGRGLAGLLGVRYHSRRNGQRPPAGSVTWRVTVEGSVARLAVRIAEVPLHRRAYKVASLPGTLHPPVAAAMSLLAGVRESHVVLDPCCGAGTTLAESGASVRIGFDLDPAAVRATIVNAGVPAVVADASAIPLPDCSIDRVLVNPPWGRAVAPSGGLAKDTDGLWREIRRVLKPGGLIAALLPSTAEDPAGFVVQRKITIRLHGRLASLLVLK